MIYVPRATQATGLEVERSFAKLRDILMIKRNLMVSIPSKSLFLRASDTLQMNVMLNQKGKGTRKISGVGFSK